MAPASASRGLPKSPLMTSISKRYCAEWAQPPSASRLTCGPSRCPAPRALGPPLASLARAVWPGALSITFRRALTTRVGPSPAQPPLVSCLLSPRAPSAGGTQSRRAHGLPEPQVAPHRGAPPCGAPSLRPAPFQGPRGTLRFHHCPCSPTSRGELGRPPERPPGPGSRRWGGPALAPKTRCCPLCPHVKGQCPPQGGSPRGAWGSTGPHAGPLPARRFALPWWLCLSPLGSSPPRSTWP